MVERAGMVGLLQDVGMLKIPEAIREKKGRLTPQEYEVVKTHVMQTAEQLRNTSGLSTEITEIAVLHHERRDGSGYPLGKKDDALGVLGAIAGIVDVFDALTSKRSYREKSSADEALNYLREQAGILFDPAIVEALANIPYAEFTEGEKQIYEK